MAFTLYKNVPAGAGNTVVKASHGVLGVAVVTVTGTGTGTANFYDNATTNSGQVLLAVPANAAAGSIYEVEGHALNGITVANVANGPVMTVFYD